ncbi:putative reverse transcriptase domain, viral movement protein [Tanacetum coccineum]
MGMGLCLSEKKMEVENPPQWTSRQTEAVKAIKCLADKMPPLKIPVSLEKRILQTDASDECWGAVLLVQDNNNKDLKRGIEKFQFHLIGHEFQVEIDMSSFPRILQFKERWPECTTFEVVKLGPDGYQPPARDFLPSVMFRGQIFLSPRALFMMDRSVMYHALYCFIHDWYKVNPSSRRWNISVWSKDHLDAYKCIEANGQWLYGNFDHCDVETSDDDDDARSLWSSDDDEHFDSIPKIDPTHLHARLASMKKDLTFNV